MSVQTKSCSKWGWLIPLALLLLITLTANTAPVAAFDLITAEEARLMKEPFTLESGGIGRGPSIEIRGPKKRVYTIAPFNLEIHFKAFNGAKINPNSINILYWSSPRRSLTERLKPFLKDDVISVTGVRAPRGVHEIKIWAQDSRGLSGALVYEFEVHK